MKFIIPARKGSKGLKNKNIKRLNNVPLIAWTILLAKKCKLIEANEWGGGDATQHGPNGIRVTNKACECKENSCKTHLHHPFCRPCGPHCVNNPLCGYLQKGPHETKAVR